MSHQVQETEAPRMQASIEQLKIALDVVETNEPINRAAGNIEQADLEAANAADFREALRVLEGDGGILSREEVFNLLGVSVSLRPPALLAVTLDRLLKQMETTEGLAEDSAPAVITFTLAAMGLAKRRTSILQTTEVSLEGGKEGETSFVIGHHANFPGCSDDPEFCRQLELSFADFLTRRNTPDAPPEIATP